MRERVFSDFDGTLCMTPGAADLDSVESLLQLCTPRPRMLERFRRLADAGHELGILTARGPHVRSATLQQLQAWLPDVDLVVVHRPRLVWDYKHWIPDKEAALRKHQVDVYIGDRREDRAAALRAGARFVWDHEFEAHGLARTIAV